MADIPLDQYQEQTPFGLYSHAAETAAALPQAKGTPDQFKAMLMKQGVKPAEIDHSGYDDVFAGRPSVTKDELVQHFRQSMPRIQEHVLGAKPEYPQHLKDKEQSIIDSYKPRISELWATSDNYSLSSEERAAARESLQDLYDQMQSHIDREIPERNKYLDITPTKFDKYTMPGGENYREALLQLQRAGNKLEQKAAEAYRIKSELVAQYDQLPPGDPRGPQIAAQIRDAQQEYNRIVDESMQYEHEPFRAGHWEQPDVLAHLRMKDRTGPNGEKILHIDEIQSDWAQKGRTAGFKEPKAKETARKARQEYNDFVNKIKEDYTNSLIDQNSGVPVEHQIKLIKNIINQTSLYNIAEKMGYKEKLNQLYNDAEKADRRTKGLPSAPYVTNTSAWTDLALKRALHEAAKGGYDKMVITPGEEHVKRFDLSRQIGEIQANPMSDGAVELIATALDDGEIVHQDIHDIDKIDDVIGKELADKVRARVKWPRTWEEYIIRNKKSGHTSDSLKTLEAAHESLNLFPESLRPDLEIVPRKWRSDGQGTTLSGGDLKIGGEGMRHFYDRLVPKQLNELVKRHDPQVKVGRDTLDTPDGPKEVHAIDITPKLRESILRGQKAFAAGGEVDDDGITAYHGSPHDFERFDLSKIGTGEGAQAFGHGLYFAGAEPVAQTYRGDPEERYRRFSGHMDPKEEYAFDLASQAGDVRDFDVMMGLAKKYGENIDFEEAQRLAEKAVSKRGHMYEVHINAHPDHFLDWDKPLRDQKHFLAPILERFGGEQSVRDAYAKWDKLNNDLVVDGQVIDRAADNPLWQEYDRLSSLGADRAKIRLGRILQALDTEQFYPDKYKPQSKLTQKGEDLWHAVSQMHKNNDVASNVFRESGIPGIKYFDAGSRGAGEGSRNYVVFDDKLVGIKRKYARGGVVTE